MLLFGYKRTEKLRCTSVEQQHQQSRWIVVVCALKMRRDWSPLQRASPVDWITHLAWLARYRAPAR